MKNIGDLINTFYEQNILAYIQSLQEYPIKFVSLILDITIVVFLAYELIKIVKGSRAWQLIKGIAFLVVATGVSKLLNLYILNYILSTVMDWGVILIIIIFQPEIRSVLESLGRTQLLGRHKVLTVDEREKVVYEIMRACEYLRKNRIGALIVIEREISLEEYIKNATKVYADISDSLLETIFFPNSPLHDGGVIIQGDRITCAGAVFRTSMNPNVSKRLGTRHRAAIGISKESDAIAIIVSEETGKISVAIDGKLIADVKEEALRNILIKHVINKRFTRESQKIRRLKIKKENKQNQDEKH